MQGATVSRDGVEIAYTTHGAGGAVGAAVVLVHGWAGNRTYWDGQIDLLAERHEVIAVDLAGHGASGLGRSDWDLAAFGDDVVAVIDAVGPERVALAGHSMGGDAIVHAARRLGDRVAGLVWVDAFRSLGNEQASSPAEVEAFVAPFREDFSAAVDRFVRSLFGATADGDLVDRVAASMAATHRESALGCLPRARNRQPPILAALPHISAPIVAINPDFTHKSRGDPHFLMMEAPDRFNPVLAATLESFSD